MKKFFLTTFLFTTAVLVQAQSKHIKEANTKFNFGITGGINIASMKAKAEGISISTNSKIGFTIGVLADFPLNNQFVLQPGLNFAQKGSKINMSFFGDIKSKETLNYIELPVNLLYRTPAGRGTFFGGAGPAFNFGIGGKSESTIVLDGQTETDKHNIKFGSDPNNDDYKPFELAGNLLIGYELSNRIFFTVNYNFGLTNIAVDNSDGSKVNNNYIGLRIGYKFGSSK
jgi:hypothetical protein